MSADRSVVTRRVLVTAASSVAAGGLAAALASSNGRRPRDGFLGWMERCNERAQRALFDPRKLAPTEPDSALTPEGHFPAYRISPGIPLSSPTWRLRVGGSVTRPSELSLEDLQRMTRTDVRVRHHCVEGWSAVASWHGVSLRDLARRVGADPQAPYVEFRSFDQGYWSSWDRPSAMHAQTILAYGMNGRPLAPAYGAPLRLYAAIKLGYKMVKYLSAVNFLPVRTGGYWEDQGYEWFAGV